jgi:hypothetical protein
MEKKYRYSFPVLRFHSGRNVDRDCSFALWPLDVLCAVIGIRRNVDPSPYPEDIGDTFPWYAGIDVQYYTAK